MSDYLNGLLPGSVLAPITRCVNGERGRLRKDAAAAFMAMNAESVRRFGVTLCASSSRVTYRDRAAQDYFWRLYLSGRGALAARPYTSNHGLGLAIDLATPAMRRIVDQIGEKYGWAKKWSDAPCVPVSTRILTRRGFVTVDDLRENDETVGFNRQTGRTEWTPVTGWATYENAQVIRYQHSTVMLDCTPQHRWLNTERDASPTAPAGLLTMDEMGAQDRVLLAASGAEGPGLPITPDEAALIGWSLTDGSIYRFENSRGKRAFARIYQSKTVGIGAVTGLMESFPHRRDDDYNGKCVMWYVGRGTFSPILHRSRLDELGIVRFVLELNAEQRAAFLQAVRMAEGTQACDMREIAQSEPDRREAFAIAAALEGHLVAYRTRTVNLKRPAVRRENLTHTPLDRQTVWCPTTTLGTWTAEQDGQIFLTGNSEWWHLKWRPGDYPAVREHSQWAGYTTAEQRWITEYDRLHRERLSPRRQQVLQRVMAEQRKRIWRAAQPKRKGGDGRGWDFAHRQRRYQSLRSRSS